MNWETFTQWLTDVSNNPVFISISSIVAILGSVLVVISRTSIGRKAIKSLTELSNGTKAEVINVSTKVKGKIEEVDSKIKELEEKKNEFLKEAENKFKVFYSQFEFYETQITAILELIPNAKVKEAVSEMKSQWSEKKKEIEEFIGVSYNEFQDKMSKLEEELKELKNGREENVHQGTEE